MQRNRLRPAGGQCITHAVPNVSALAEFLWRETRLLQPHVKGF